MAAPTPPGQSASNASVWRKPVLWVGVLVLVNAAYLLCDSGLRATLIDRVGEWVPGRQVCGFIEQSFRDADGVEYRYMVFVPHAVAKNERLPLLVYLNGTGENGPDPIAPLRNGMAHALWEDEQNFPFVVVWPKCDAGDAWTANSRSTARAMAIAKTVAERYQTDPDRVYLSGISSGGAGTWAVAARYAVEFAAMIPVSGTVEEKVVRQVAKARLPVWAYSDEDDSVELVKSNRQAHQVLLGLGLSPHLTEVGTKGDDAKDGHDAWSFAYRDGGMYRWLTAQRRSHRSTEKPRFELIELSQVAEPGLSVESPDPIFGSMIRIPAGGEEKLLGVEAVQSGQQLSEIDLEFRGSRGIKRFGVGMLCRSPEASRVGTLIDLAISDVNSGGIYTWPGKVCVTASSPVAEQGYLREGWNDLRVRFERGRIVVELNGWTLIDREHEGLVTPEAVLGFVAQGELTAHVVVRNLRVRRERQSSLPSEQIKAATPNEVHATTSEASGVSHVVSVDAILAGWKRREESHPEVDLSWTSAPGYRFATSSVRSAGTATEADQYRGGLSQLKLTPEQIRYSSPWQHARLDLTRKVGLRDSTTLRDYQRVFKASFVEVGEKQPDSLTLSVACDGMRRVDYVSDESGRGYRGIEFGRADVWRDRVGEMDDLLWRGPLLAFRPLSKCGIGCRSEQCVVLPEMAWAGGTRCVVLDEISQAEGSTFQRRFWADPQRDFLVLKCTVTVDGLLREQIDVQYSINSMGMWWPVGWEAVAWPRLASSISEFQFAGNEWLFQAASAKVMHNPPADDTTIAQREVRIPPGTIGFDQRTNEWFEQLADTQRRKLDPSEVMARTVADISWERGSPRDTRWIVGGLVVLAGGWILIRRLRRRGQYA